MEISHDELDGFSAYRDNGICQTLQEYSSLGLFLDKSYMSLFLYYEDLFGVKISNFSVFQTII